MDSESFVYYLEKKEFLLTRSSCERYSPKKKNSYLSYGGNLFNFVRQQDKCGLLRS